MYSQVEPPDNISIQIEGTCELKNRATIGNEAKNLSEKPAHVTDDKWQKFQQLKERRLEICKPLPERMKRSRKRYRNRIDNDDACSSKTAKKLESEIVNDNKNAWKELCSNIDANSHLTQHNIAKQKPKSKLEEKLDEALKEGKFSEAETISDEIAKQELGVKIADAIETREYKKQKEVEEKWKENKKKKKLLWGFEQKERWESKGNM